MNHGTHAGYYAHKRAHEPACDDCLKAYRRWMKQWKLERERTGPRMIDATETRAHIRALLAAGLSLRGIAKAAGVNASTLANLTTRDDQRTIHKRTASKVLAVHGPVFTPTDEADEGFVPKIGAVRRIRALMAIGWTHAHMRAESGVLTHVLLAQSGQWITVRNHHRIAEMYDRLSMTPGPSERSRQRAVARGFMPPLAWDEDMLDDPLCHEFTNNEVTDLYKNTTETESADLDDVAVERFISGTLAWNRLSRAERIEAALRMDRRGYTRNTIAERTRLNSATLWAAFKADASEPGETIAS